jgi:hypothetical protein
MQGNIYVADSAHSGGEKRGMKNEEKRMKNSYLNIRKKNRPSAIMWIGKYIIIPLTPFVFEFFLNWIVKGGGKIQLEFFDTITLTLAVGLLCLFVSQSLYEKKYLYNYCIPNEERDEDISRAAGTCTAIAVILLLFFGLLVFIQALDKYKDIQLNDILFRMNIFVLAIVTISIIGVVCFRKKFGLKAG